MLTFAIIFFTFFLTAVSLLLQLDANMDYIPTRMTKVSTPKPAANPLQFVKVGPCDLFKSAQETLKKVEEVKKMKREVRDEAEEWQSVSD